MVQLKESLLSNNSNDSNLRSNQDTSLVDEINQIDVSSLVKLAIEKVKIQRYLTLFIHRKTLQTIRSNWSPRDINRLNSCCDEGAISFTTIPILPEHRIEIGFGVLICLRLGIDFIGLPSGECLCGEILTQSHHINCHHGNLRQTIHDATKKELKILATKAGHTTTEEDRRPCLFVDPNTKMRMDLVLKNFLPGRDKCIDVMVVNPDQARYNDRAILP